MKETERKMQLIPFGRLKSEKKKLRQVQAKEGEQLSKKWLILREWQMYLLYL